MMAAHLFMDKFSQAANRAIFSLLTDKSFLMQNLFGI